MTERSAWTVVPQQVPSIADLLADGSKLKGLPIQTLLTLRQQVGHLAVELDTAITHATVLMAQGHRPATDDDRLLTPADAALIFSVKARWLLEHADEIPGTRRLSRKVIRFSQRGLRRHLDGMKA